MTSIDFVLPSEEPVYVTLGKWDEKIKFDVSFINSAKGYQIQQVLSHRKEGEPLSPGIMSQVVAIAARGQVDESINSEWIQQHLDYKTLEKVFVLVIDRAYGRAEKNV